MRALRLLPLLLLVAACGGGGGGAAAHACDGSQSLCLLSCSLGCAESGCGVAEIAENEVLKFTFDQPVDVATVAAGIRLTGSGGEPAAGSFWTAGASVSFVPEQRIVAGNARFGFKANDTYSLRLLGGADEPSPLRSVTGKPLVQDLACSLQVTRGIVDQDHMPPAMTLVTPSGAQRGAAPRDGKVVLRFSEAIDASGLFGQSSASSPVVFRLRKTKDAGNNQRVCDPAAAPTILEGTLAASFDAASGGTVVTLTPAIVLPSLACVEIEVTPKIRDLAGTPASTAVETFLTEAGPVQDLAVTELFANGNASDAAVSSGAWGSGALVPGVIGGDGLHGDFDPGDGQEVAPNTWLWSTDDQPIRAVVWKDASPPLSPVTDGVFRFASLRIPAGMTVVFRGRNAARILVRGNVSIEGRLVLNGADVVLWDGTLAAGQPESAGGAGGGRGGRGAARCSGQGTGGGAFAGGDGEDVRIASTHAYGARASGTRGAGGAPYPASGSNQDVTYRWSFDQFCAMVPAGGGGGGNDGAGGEGKATASPTNELGAPSAGGVAFDPFPVPIQASSLEHFVIGGAGGGGGGSHPFLATKGFPSGPHWFSGACGAGGGGALALRVGRDLVMVPGSAIEARGGSGVGYGLAELALGPPAPGGGGAGGSVLLQAAGLASLRGAIDVRGGAGSSWDLTALLPATCRGGDGASGSLRLEMPAKPDLTVLGTTQPPAQPKSVDALRDTDTVVGAQSRWYSTRQAFAPAFLRYEAELEQGSTRRVFSDDPAVGPIAGFGSAQPITVLVQGASVSPATAIPIEGGLREWRDRVGPFGPRSLDGDAVNGFRFIVLFDRRIAAGAVVRRLSVVFREKT